MARARERLDVLVVEAGLAPSRNKARALIMTGDVLVDDRPATKAGALVERDATIRLRAGAAPLRYVSRGGLKLETALDAFDLDVAGRVAIDVGASTGGFTDCLLQRGVARVYAVDVGYGQLAWSLRQDERVEVLERTNIRHLEPTTLHALGPPPDLAVADLSFISLTKVLGPLRPLLAQEADLVVLVKPQFEAGPDAVERGGVVRDDEVRADAIRGVIRAAQELGFAYRAGVDSQTPGAKKGNVEHLVWLRWVC